jgi:hypothetical protein
MMKETPLKGTDYSYILGREFVIFSNGVTMSIEEFKTFHNKGILVRKIMSLARVPKRLSDYRIALDTGVMTPVYMPVRTMQLNPEKPKLKKIKKVNEVFMSDYNQRPEIIVEPEREQKKRFTTPNKSQVILFCMLFIAIGSAGMSIYHAAAFLIMGGKPFLISVMTAILIVMFASTGFTAARYFSEQRGMAKIFALPFVAITCVLICYIAFSTTSVSYEQFRDEEANRVATVQKEIGSLELYKEVQRSILETEKYINTLDKNRVADMTQAAVMRHQRMLAAEREKLQKLRERAYDLKERSGGGSVEDKQQSIASVYDFLMELFGINTRVLRFVIYVIPAVFYDIVAPFGFTVVFFLVDNKKEEHDEA